MIFLQKATREIYSDERKWHSYFVKGNVAPFLDLRVGYTPLVDATGYCLSPSLGCCFGLAERVGLNVCVGYEIQDSSLYFYDNYYSTFIGVISLTVALDF